MFCQYSLHTAVSAPPFYYLAACLSGVPWQRAHSPQHDSQRLQRPNCKLIACRHHKTFSTRAIKNFLLLKTSAFHATELSTRKQETTVVEIL